MCIESDPKFYIGAGQPIEITILENRYCLLDIGYKPRTVGPARNSDMEVRRSDWHLWPSAIELSGVRDPNRLAMLFQRCPRGVVAKTLSRRHHSVLPMSQAYGYSNGSRKGDTPSGAT